MARPLARINVVLALAALSVLASGCVRAYKVSSLDKSFIKAREQTKGVVHKAFDDVNARREKLKGFQKTVPDHDPAVWQKMKDLTEQMASVGKEMSSFPGSIETLPNQLKLVVGKRTKIRSDEARLWNQVEGIKGKLEGALLGVQGSHRRVHRPQPGLPRPVQEAPLTPLSPSPAAPSRPPGSRARRGARC